MADLKQLRESSYAVVEQKLEALCHAIHSNDFGKVSKAETELKEAEKEYAKDKRVEVFALLKDTPNPVRAALEQYSYEIVGHKLERDADTGIITGVEMKAKAKQIDLVEYFKFIGKVPTFKNKAEKLNQLLAVQTALELGQTKARVTEIRDSFTMSDIARKLDLGETPTSVNQIVKLLQMVVDDILYEDNNGKNKLKVISRDAKYLMATYAKRGKEKCTVKVAKNNYLISIISDIMYRLVTDGMYDVEGFVLTGDKAKLAKAKAKADAKKETEKVSKPEPEKVSKPKTTKKSK